MTCTSDKVSGTLSAMKIVVSASADFSAVSSWRLYTTLEVKTDGNTFRGLSSVTSVSRDSLRAHIDYTKTYYDGSYAYIFGDSTRVQGALASDAVYTLIGPRRTYLSG